MILSHSQFSERPTLFPRVNEKLPSTVKPVPVCNLDCSEQTIIFSEIFLMQLVHCFFDRYHNNLTLIKFLLLWTGLTSRPVRNPFIPSIYSLSPPILFFSVFLTSLNFPELTDAPIPSDPPGQTFSLA